MYYFPRENILVEIVEAFNKRNDTYISYMRNQYNALENYTREYCNDNNKFLFSRDGRATGINYKFRNALYDVISTKKEVEYLLDSREVNTLHHLEPLIYDENDGTIRKHEAFNNSYNVFKSRPGDVGAQRRAIGDLCALLYLVRCNVAHTGKTNRGPNRAKIERDMLIAKIITGINKKIFNIIMDHPERKLACYGTLVDSIYVSGMKSTNGHVNGYLDYDEEGIAYFTYELGTGALETKLYVNSKAIDFKEMDSYEGGAYERIFVPIKCNGKIQIANIYERKYLYE